MNIRRILSAGQAANGSSLTHEQKLNRDVRIVSRYILAVTVLGVIFVAIDQMGSEARRRSTMGTRMVA